MLRNAIDGMLAREWLDNAPSRIAVESTASEVCKRLADVFRAFEQTITPNEEIGLGLSSFGVTHQIVVEEVIASDPNLIVIRGYENGQPVSLVQHISQLSILLIALPKAVPDEPRRVIGFRSE